MKTLRISKVLLIDIFKGLFTKGENIVIHDKHAIVINGFERDAKLTFEKIDDDVQRDQIKFSFGDGKEEESDLEVTHEVWAESTRWIVLYYHWGLPYTIMNEANVAVFDLVIFNMCKMLSKSSVKVDFSGIDINY